MDNGTKLLMATAAGLGLAGYGILCWALGYDNGYDEAYDKGMRLGKLVGHIESTVERVKKDIEVKKEQE